MDDQAPFPVTAVVASPGLTEQMLTNLDNTRTTEGAEVLDTGASLSTQVDSSRQVASIGAMVLNAGPDGVMSWEGSFIDPDGGEDWIAASNDVTDITLFRYGTREATPPVTSAADAAGAVGKPFSYRIEASSNPTHFGANGLASWMTLDTATGEITGTPTATGSTSLKVFAYNQYAASIKDVTVSVIDQFQGTCII